MERKNEKSINFFGFRVKLYMKENLPFEYSEENTETHYLSIGRNFVFPVSFEQRTYNELLRSEEQLTVEQATENGCTILSGQLDSQLSAGAIVVNKTHEVVEVSEDTVNIKLNYECIEEIGAQVPIEIQ